MTDNVLHLNKDKTEILIFGAQAQRNKIASYLKSVSLDSKTEGRNPGVIVIYTVILIKINKLNNKISILPSQKYFQTKGLPLIFRLRQINPPIQNKQIRLVYLLDSPNQAFAGYSYFKMLLHLFSLAQRNTSHLFSNNCTGYPSNQELILKSCSLFIKLYTALNLST